ncbi:MAG: 50S ribosomal protein L18 [Pseudomonadota bacterium]|nr:50S ribosomal protein L18 [Pseudomonadota bacterium]MEC8471164.1 50S ribosomal protein L18 [Pseudomonadota bacterium]MEC8587734.1 50S ribosomal protein L18 [Pseudomonadota bacterium]MEC8804417.1 50S ribosomal protein L18 [Pseudomonadota bacterium]MEE3011099.1 50S ribosomal protein L18 [Pseudomonadota bacterium]
MNVKKGARLRRAKRARSKISKLRMNRLCVFRSPRHIYAQVISPEGDKVLASASTVEKENRTGATGNVDAAGKVGKMIAERAKAIGVESVAFDRSGYAYHGRIKALADAARESGLQF